MTGCTSTGSTSPAPAATQTPQIVYVTVLVTPTLTVTTVQDPIIGVWRVVDGDLDRRVRFNADGTTVLSAYIPKDGTSVFYGTWKALGNNVYTTSMGASTGDITVTYIYEPAKNNIHNTVTPTLLLTPYQGDIMAASPSASTPTYSSQSSSSGSTHLSGYGDDVQSFTSTGSGLRVFTMRNSGGEIGNRNFAVILKDQNGKTISLLANEIGDYSGKKSTVLQSGKYYLDVSSGGSWSIDITSA